MARNQSEFKNDGIPAGLSYALKVNTNINTAADLVAAPAIASQAVVVTDLVIATKHATRFSVQDDATVVLDLWVPGSGTNTVNFTGPLKITAGNPLKIKRDNTGIEYSVLCTYYIED